MSEKKEEPKKEIRATVTVKTAKAIAAYADKNELGVGEAIDKMIGTCVSRLAALARYAKNKEPKAPGKPRAKKAAKAKATAKKAKATAKKAKAAPANNVNGVATHAEAAAN